MLAARLRYYLASVLTILAGVRNWPVLLPIALPWPRRGPICLVLRRTGLRFRVRDLLDAWIIKEVCLDREYERVSVPLEDGWIVVDIGAGIGEFAVAAAARAPRGVVHAYEPFPPSFALLTENIALNGLANVRAHRLAVGAAGSATLDISAPAAAWHRLVAGDAAPPAAAPAVESVTLDAILAALPRCDFLKLDCEGAEYPILLGAGIETLHKIRHICLEYHDWFTPHDHADLATFLSARGFRVAIHPSRTHRRIGLLHAARAERDA